MPTDNIDTTHWKQSRWMHSEIVIFEVPHVTTSLAPEPSMQQLSLPGREAQRQGPKGNAQVGAPAAVCNVGGAHQPQGGVSQPQTP